MTDTLFPLETTLNQSPSSSVTQSLYPNPLPCKRLDVNHKTG